jgi:hypothetical protein
MSSEEKRLKLAELEEKRHKREWAEVNRKHLISGVCLAVSVFLLAARVGQGGGGPVMPIAFLVGLFSFFIFLDAHGQVAEERTRHEIEIARLANDEDAPDAPITHPDL